MVSALTRETPSGNGPVHVVVQATKSDPGLSVRSISPFTKKNSLSRARGPLNDAPACRKLRSGRATTSDPRTVLPSRFSLRPNVNLLGNTVREIGRAHV